MEPRKRRGRPPGSTNKPKVENAPLAADQQIAARLGDLVDVMLGAAIEDRNVGVAKYLIDRVLGKPTEKAEVTTKGEQTIKVEYVEDWRNQ